MPRPVIGPQFAVAQGVGVVDVVGQVAAVHFVDDGAAGGEQAVADGGGGQRGGEVGHHADVVGVAQGGDLHEGGDAAHVGHGGAQPVDQVGFHQRADAVHDIPELFPGGQRHAGLVSQAFELGGVGDVSDRIFHEEGVQGFQQFAQAGDVRQVEPCVGIQDPVAVIAHAPAHLFSHPGGLVHGFSGVPVAGVVVVYAVEAHGPEAGIHH